MGDLREIVLPKELGETVESLIVFWNKDSGDTFEKDELLLEVQTDKVAYEVPAPFSGVLYEVKVKRGETAKGGQVIATATEKNV
ncbi:biotin-dependent enzyme [Lutibacter oceani]|uniref:Biotin-dependent enzyme n=1 Tax=Lutibacter oceani TaxID=1853311 RepID=A0A3D9RS99_9FLAO|nr:biotin/lipoyl-containing protein [Lutibacter oceani]REE82790.1 biotin-dependent enzyme [Lutibacter oceani]